MLGGEWIVNGAIEIANAFNVSQSLIGLTVVAIGTSLPELATSAVAAWKRNTDIAVGNIIGSNIFNIFWVLGVSAIIKPLPFQTSTNFDILMTIFASLLFFAFVFIGKKHVLQRWQGGVFFILYIAYLVLIVSKG
jgi:cation:H+ antiporter